MGVVRKTQSVNLVLEAFKVENKAISVIDLVDRFNNKVNKTTVYRVLDRLEDDGVLHSFLGTNGIKWYAPCKGCNEHKHTDVHPHFQCTDCGKIDCLDVDVKIPSLPNREVSGAQVLIQGRCEACIKN